MSQTFRIAAHSAETDEHQNKGEKSTGNDDHTNDCSRLKRNFSKTYQKTEIQKFLEGTFENALFQQLLCQNCGRIALRDHDL